MWPRRSCPHLARLALTSAQAGQDRRDGLVFAEPGTESGPVQLAADEHLVEHAGPDELAEVERRSGERVVAGAFLGVGDRAYLAVERGGGVPVTGWPRRTAVLGPRWARRVDELAQQIGPGLRLREEGLPFVRAARGVARGR